MNLDDLTFTALDPEGAKAAFTYQGKSWWTDLAADPNGHRGIYTEDHQPTKDPIPPQLRAVFSDRVEALAIIHQELTAAGVSAHMARLEALEVANAEAGGRGWYLVIDRSSVESGASLPDLVIGPLPEARAQEELDRDEGTFEVLSTVEAKSGGYVVGEVTAGYYENRPGGVPTNLYDIDPPVSRNAVGDKSVAEAILALKPRQTAIVFGQHVTRATETYGRDRRAKYVITDPDTGRATIAVGHRAAASRADEQAREQQMPASFLELARRSPITPEEAAMAQRMSKDGVGEAATVRSLHRHRVELATTLIEVSSQLANQYINENLTIDQIITTLRALGRPHSGEFANSILDRLISADSQGRYQYWSAESAGTDDPDHVRLVGGRNGMRLQVTPRAGDADHDPAFAWSVEPAEGSKRNAYAGTTKTPNQAQRLALSAAAWETSGDATRHLWPGELEADYQIDIDHLGVRVVPAHIHDGLGITSLAKVDAGWVGEVRRDENGEFYGLHHTEDGVKSDQEVGYLRPQTFQTPLEAIKHVTMVSQRPAIWDELGSSSRDLWEERWHSDLAAREALIAPPEPGPANNTAPKSETVLVAFEVREGERNRAQERLLQALDHVLDDHSNGVDALWIAEDDRLDRSDCDSAVFVPYGAQADVRTLISDWATAHHDQWVEHGYPYEATDVSGTWFNESHNPVTATDTDLPATTSVGLRWEVARRAEIETTARTLTTGGAAILDRNWTDANGTCLDLLVKQGDVLLGVVVDQPDSTHEQVLEATNNWAKFKAVKASRIDARHVYGDLTDHTPPAAEHEPTRRNPDFDDPSHYARAAGPTNPTQSRGI